MPERRSRLLPVIALAMALCFAAAIGFIMHERAAAGDGYDLYSTYRSDPLGLAVLFDALSAMPGHTVERNLQDIYRLRMGENTTLLFAGAIHSPDPESLVESIAGFVRTGGRLILAFQPLGLPPDRYAAYREAAIPGSDEEDKQEDGESGGGAESDDVSEAEAAADEETESARARRMDPGLTWIDEAWGFRYAVGDFGDTLSEEPLEGLRVGGGAELPATVAWYSTDYFEPKMPEWKTLYEVDERAVLMERAWGQGSVVVASDSYFLSNEGLAYDPAPALLAWLFEGHSRIVIDETIHNVRRELGIMGLVRRYRLTALLAAFVVVALLYVWKQASPLVPRHSLVRERDVAQAQSMRDAHTGLVRLLARSVPRKNLIPAAIEAWRRSNIPHASPADPRLARVQAIAARDPDGERPVETYRDIVRSLKERI